MNKKIRFGLLALAITLTIGTPAKAVSASDSVQISKAQSLVTQALKEKTFYTYNIAYFSILDVQDEYSRNVLLAKLAVISNQIYTPQILHYLDLLSQVAKTSSGKLYDNTVSEIRGSNLNDFDKGYLLGELTGWGQKMVYTPDYVNGVWHVVNGWNNINSDNFYSVVATSQTEVNKVVSSINRDYLLEELGKVKAVQERNTDIMKRIIQIKVSTLSRDEKVEELQKALLVSNSLIIPDGYTSGAGIYAIADTLFSQYANNPATISDAQAMVDNAVAVNESMKFKGQFNTGEYVELNANNGQTNLDVTNQVTVLNYPLLDGAKFTLAAPEVTNGYITVIDGKVYLAPKSVSDTVYENLVLNLSYNNVSTTTQIRIKILP